MGGRACPIEMGHNDEALMNKDDIVGLFTLYLSGAVEMKNSKEIIY